MDRLLIESQDDVFRMHSLSAKERECILKVHIRSCHLSEAHALCNLPALQEIVVENSAIEQPVKLRDMPSVFSVNLVRSVDSVTWKDAELDYLEISEATLTKSLGRFKVQSAVLHHCVTTLPNTFSRCRSLCRLRLVECQVVTGRISAKCESVKIEKCSVDSYDFLSRFTDVKYLTIFGANHLPEESELDKMKGLELLHLSPPVDPQLFAMIADRGVKLWNGRRFK